MKKTMKQLSFAALAIIGLGLQSSFAQTADSKADNHSVAITIPEVALLDIETTTTKNIAMAFVVPTEAGNPIVAPANNLDIWLNYSSIVTAAAPDNVRKVTVTSDKVIPGININVTAGAATATGAGTKGTPAGTITINNTQDQEFISSVGSCWTDTGASKGHQLTYALVLTSAGTYSSLVAGATTVTVTYTLSDN